MANGGQKVDGRRVIDALRKVMEASSNGGPLEGTRAAPEPPRADLPPDSFIDGWQAERVLRHLMGANPSVTDLTELGPYIPSGQGQPQPQGQQDVLKLSEKTHVVAFPERLVLLFASMDQEKIETLSALMSMAPEVVQTLRQMARNEIEKAIRRRVWRKAYQLAAAGAVGAFYVAHFGVEQLAWIVNAFPSVKEVFPWLTGLSK